jgi:hypothetical protein
VTKESSSDHVVRRIHDESGFGDYVIGKEGDEKVLVTTWLVHEVTKNVFLLFFLCHMVSNLQSFIMTRSVSNSCAHFDCARNTPYHYKEPSDEVMLILCLGAIWR